MTFPHYHWWRRFCIDGWRVANTWWCRCGALRTVEITLPDNGPREIHSTFETEADNLIQNRLAEFKKSVDAMNSFMKANPPEADEQRGGGA